MFWQKLIIVTHYLCIWSWIITIFDLKKDPKVEVKFFENFQKRRGVFILDIEVKHFRDIMSEFKNNFLMKHSDQDDFFKTSQWQLSCCKWYHDTVFTLVANLLALLPRPKHGFNLTYWLVFRRPRGFHTKSPWPKIFWW